MLLDIDRFGTINDVAGFDIGNAILIELSNRLRSIVENQDSIIARIGEDTFAIAIVNKNPLPSVDEVANKIKTEVSKYYFFEDKEYHLSISMGVAISTHNSISTDLYKQANIALANGKGLGGNCVHFYDNSEQILYDERNQLEFELQHISDFDEQLCLYYQTQIDRNHVIRGMEALIRWKHPQLGLLPPSKFLPIIEQSSLSVKIGKWVVEKACAQLKKWTNEFKNNELSISINISNKQFHDPLFVKIIRDNVIKYNINPSLLKLELTEEIVMNFEHALTQVSELKKIGVTLALDDFGTGYSSLSYIKKLNIDQLKIDQSFVRDIFSETPTGIITKTIIELAKNLELEVLAEGVETEEQLEFLKKNGCDSFQGYLFGRPLPIEELKLIF